MSLHGTALCSLWFCNVVFVLIAWFTVYLEPLAAGSGIPEIKCFLNGINKYYCNYDYYSNNEYYRGKYSTNRPGEDSDMQSAWNHLLLFGGFASWERGVFLICNFICK